MNRPIIIGAGISGLVAALELEKAGYFPIILEATNKIGGRVRTDVINGTPLDHGFQVLLTAYPEAQHYLDYDQLDLINFLPGSVIFDKKEMRKIGDPLRDSSFLWSTLFSGIGSLRDKLLVLFLNRKLKKKSIKAIFNEAEISTATYLRDFGFSDGMIHQFFQPFFAGIFLEKELSTSSRMFEFVFKMFSTGNAAIPRRGMEAIPLQLVSQLKRTDIRTNSAVRELDGNTIKLENGETLSSNNIIVAVSPELIRLKSDRSNAHKWKSCVNLYFEIEESVLQEPIIGLVPDKSLLVNNVHYVSDVFGKAEKAMLSVTVVTDELIADEVLEREVRAELLLHCNIQAGKLVKSYVIKKALPNVNGVQYEPTPEDVAIRTGVYCCGDYLANGSLNAAMASGRVAARMVK